MNRDHDIYFHETPDVNGTHVLLVDPDIPSLHHTASLLQSVSFTVTPVADRALAIETLKQGGEQFSVVVASLDARNAEFTTFLSHLRHIKDGIGIPIIVLLPGNENDRQTDPVASSDITSFYLEGPLTENGLPNLCHHLRCMRDKIASAKDKKAANGGMGIQIEECPLRIIENGKIHPDNNLGRASDKENAADPKGKGQQVLGISNGDKSTVCCTKGKYKRTVGIEVAGSQRKHRKRCESSKGNTRGLWNSGLCQKFREALQRAKVNQKDAAGRTNNVHEAKNDRNATLCQAAKNIENQVEQPSDVSKDSNMGSEGSEKHHNIEENCKTQETGGQEH